MLKDKNNGAKMKTKELEKAFERIKREVSNEVRKKMESVHIDFDKDNYLPELNQSDLDYLRVKSKPVLLKKVIIEKNKTSHPDINEMQSIELIANGLYNANGIFPGNSEKPYFNFISYLGGDINAVVLLEIADNKDNFEIVNWYFARKRSRELLEKKGEEIKNEKN
jgi:hypothetical protein